MERYLITKSIVESYEYFISSDKDTAQEDWLNVLNKKFVTNKYIEAGNQLEKDIMSCIAKEEDYYSPAVLEISHMLKKGNWQVPLKKNADVFGYPVLLYGRADCILENCIYDVKYKASMYELPSYNTKLQHLMYMYLSGIHTFKYLIVHQDNLCIEEYNFTSNSESILFGRIKQMLDVIMDNKEYKEIFLSKWIAKGRR